METHSSLWGAHWGGLAGGSEWFLTSNVMDTFHTKFHAFTS